MPLVADGMLLFPTKMIIRQNIGRKQDTLEKETFWRFLILAATEILQIPICTLFAGWPLNNWSEEWFSLF